MSAGVLFSPALITARGPAPKRGTDLGSVQIVRDAALAWHDGILTHAGPAADLPAQLAAGPAFHAAGAVVPGLVDCHTHLPFFGWRADEFEARLAGRTYQDVHGSGGGIARSARLLAGAVDEEVMEFCAPLAAEMLAPGTTAVELKAGYGL